MVEPRPLVEIPHTFKEWGDLWEYAEGLREAREVAMNTPLALGFEFDWQFPTMSHPESYQRPLSPLLTSGRTLRCTLLEPIAQAEPDHNAQIWRARVISSLSTSTPATESDFVLKIIQPSMLPYPETPHRVRIDRLMAVYDFPEQIARNEAMVYEALKELQGDTIPFFFGINKARHLSSIFIPI